MTESCPPLRELLDLQAGAGRQPLDARRDHVASCARCRSLLAAYRSFLHETPRGATGGEAVGGDAAPGETEAVRRLHSFLQSHVLGEEERSARSMSPAAPEDGAAAGRRRAADGPLSRRWLRFLVPASGAAAIAAAVLLLLVNELPRPSHGPALRDAPATSGSTSVAALAPRLLPDGGVELTWRRMAEAEEYRVRLLDSGLHELQARNAGPDTVLVLDPAFLSAAPEALFWQVEASSEGDRIGDSVPVRLPRASHLQD